MSEAYWKTAREWADLKLEGLASTKQGIIFVAKREDWQSLGEGFARKRAGRGGGWEYHLNCLPKPAQDDFRRREEAKAKSAALEAAKEKDGQVVAQTTENLTARQSLIMQSRATVLREIERREIVEGGSRRQTILQIIAEYDADCNLPEDLRVLPDSLFQAARHASGRGHKLSRSQIYSWLKLRKAGGVAALAPKLTRVKQERPAYLNDFLRYYCRPSEPTIADALRRMADRASDPETVPSYDQVTRALKQLKGTANWLDAHRGREGALALKARLAFTRRSTEDLEPTEIYTSDGTTFDAEVAHPRHGRPFKPEVTLTIDVATRKAVGWSAGLAENAESVADALRRACERHGIPALFYTDRGSGYKNERLGKEAIGIASRLGITIDHARPQNAQARGLMERVHRTVLVPFAKTYPTYLGKEMDRQASQRVHKRTRKEITEFGESKVLPSWEQFLGDLEKEIEAYNDRPHSALPKIKDAVTGKKRYQSPNEYWAHFESLGFEAFKVSEEESQDLFRPYKERQVRRCEIQLETNRYFSHELSPFNDQYVYVGYDMHDASKVWVREIDRIDGAPTPGRLLAIATFAGNETRYYAVTATDAAKEKRAKNRLKRLDVKRDEVLDELNAPVMLSQYRSVDPLDDLQAKDIETLNIAPIRPEEQPVSEAGDQLANEKPAGLYFTDDISLAKWALENPLELTEGQITVLRDLVTRKSGRDLLEISGVEVDDIRNLIRNAA